MGLFRIVSASSDGMAIVWNAQVCHWDSNNYYIRCVLKLVSQAMSLKMLTWRNHIFTNLIGRLPSLSGWIQMGIGSGPNHIHPERLNVAECGWGSGSQDYMYVMVHTHTIAMQSLWFVVYYDIIAEFYAINPSAWYNMEIERLVCEDRCQKCWWQYHSKFLHDPSY